MSSGRGFRQEVLAAARKEWGPERVKDGRKHWKLYPPDGSRPIILSKGTRAMGERGEANIRAELKRKGLEL